MPPPPFKKTHSYTKLLPSFYKLLDPLPSEGGQIKFITPLKKRGSSGYACSSLFSGKDMSNFKTEADKINTYISNAWCYNLYGTISITVTVH